MGSRMHSAGRPEATNTERRWATLSCKQRSRTSWSSVHCQPVASNISGRSLSWPQPQLCDLSLGLAGRSPPTTQKQLSCDIWFSAQGGLLETAASRAQAYHGLPRKNGASRNHGLRPPHPSCGRLGPLWPALCRRCAGSVPALSPRCGFAMVVCGISVPPLCGLWASIVLAL